ncbi:phage major capsid protein [Oceanibacterium hippocampi]|uniref:Phage capsid family protein n=1 Tax=Oceanibacterium hippocampi TaxID=745714 RepID=A0A1Y5TZ11_9PROT|nr:phage major capsid protein [Oceanibacterium hippocampi]SLN77295.1 Phage capsid family protein [Oceanibacterium hippocampi]
MPEPAALELQRHGFRLGQIHLREAGDGKPDDVEVAFSSDTRVDRGYYIEVLDHSAGAVDLEWLGSGRASFLMDHDSRNQIGIVVNARIDDDGVGRASVRFGKSARAKEAEDDIRGGTRPNVSVGYEIRDAIVVGEENDIPIVMVTRWRPFEISSVSTPADEATGIGRSAAADAGSFTIPLQQTRSQMEPTPTPTPATPAPAATPASPPQPSADEIARARREAQDSERARIREIVTLGQRHNCSDLAEKAVTEGRSLAEFRGIVLDKIGESKPLETPRGELGMEDGEVRQFSLYRAIRAHRAGNWAQAGFEAECNRAVAERVGQDPRGFYVPYDILKAPIRADMQQRDINKGTAAQGGYLVGTDHRADSFIELLRNRMVIRQLGARVLSGLVGDVAIPKRASGATAYWIATEGGNTTESTPTFGTAALTPKTVSARVDITRQMLLQSDPSVEGLTRDDLALSLAIAMDAAAISGSGADGQPRGILNMTGPGLVPGDTDGAALTWADVVQLETEVAIDNADMGSLAYLTNVRVRGDAKVTTKVASDAAAGFIWENSANPLNGYAAAVSNQVPSNLTKGGGSNLSAMIFGDWSQLLIGEWGVLDLKPDETTLGDSGGLVLRAFQSADLVARHPESFATREDIITVA